MILHTLGGTIERGMGCILLHDKSIIFTPINMTQQFHCHTKWYELKPKRSECLVSKTGTKTGGKSNGILFQIPGYLIALVMLLSPEVWGLRLPLISQASSSLCSLLQFDSSFDHGKGGSTTYGPSGHHPLPLFRTVFWCPRPISLRYTIFLLLCRFSAHDVVLHYLYLATHNFMSKCPYASVVCV